MCKKFVFVISSILMLVYGSTSVAATYYVSPSGNDNNAGTSPSTAWATIDKVNDVSFANGDSVLFEGGQSFSGTIWIGVDDGGTASSPLIISSYGTGRATVTSGLTDGIYVYNRAGLEISDMIFVGADPASRESFTGINVWTDLAGDVKLEHLYIDNVDVSGYPERGISVGGWNNRSGFKDVRITNSDIHGNGDIGIFTWGYQYPASGWANEDFYIAYCNTYDNSGLSSKNSNTGSGIIISGVDGAVVEFCESWNNGWLNSSRGEGPVGIWPYDANNVVIQFCESHHNKTKGADGGGFDIDGGCQNCVLQYNYSHDNYGAGYLICQYSGARAYRNNVVRYCISANDGIGAVKNMGALYFWSSGSSGGIQDTEIYGNTFYTGPGARGETVKSFSGTNTIFNTRIHNNIIVKNTPSIDWVIRLRNCTSATYTFQGNCYWCSGGPVSYSWSGATYNGIAAWRAGTGQEMLSGNPVGYETNPLLVNPGGSADTDYKLQASSTMKDAGLNLPALFGIDPGPHDYFETSIPQNGSYDVGAHEYTGGAPDTTPPTPNPMTWVTVPYATGSTSIAMVATTATDASGVQYYFDCTTAGGHDSGWQTGTSYTDTGLSPGTQYCYRVQARDNSPNQNTTAWSTTECATTQTGGDTTPPSPNPMTWATVPYATGTTSIAMVATTATDASGVQYYFDCTSGAGHDSGWQSGTSYTDTGLSPNTQYCYRVQARDLSPNQNATGWSTTQCATTQSGGGAVSLFYDGFESGNFTAGGWVTGGVTKIQTEPYTGVYSARTDYEGWFEKSLSTVGYTNIHLKYARKTDGLDAGEYLYVRWSVNGSDWYDLEATNDTSWAAKDMACGSGADNNAGFRVRFYCNGNKHLDYSYTDDVEITGAAQ